MFLHVGGGKDLQRALDMDMDGRDDHLAYRSAIWEIPADLSSYSHVSGLGNSINFMNVVYSQTRIHCLASIQPSSLRKNGLANLTGDALRTNDTSWCP